MPETLTDIKDADQQFFHAVVREPALRRALEARGFSTPLIAAAQHNAILILTRRGWTLPRPSAHARTLNVHFEARTRSEFRLEVGPDPWIGGLDRKPEIKQEMAPVLARRARIMDALRSRLLNARDLPQGVEVNTRNLLRAEATAAHTVVKFKGGLPADPTPAQAAHFFVAVIEAVMPIVNEILAAAEAH